MSESLAEAKLATPARSIVGLVLRRTALSSLSLAVILALVSITSVISYHSDYDNPAKRHILITKLNADPGIRAVFGSPSSLETLGGWVGWRSLALAGYVAIAWGVLVATRVTRGEEEAGRWALLACGPITRRNAALAVAMGLALSLALTWVVFSIIIVGLGFVVPGISIINWLQFTTVLVVAPAIFIAIGMVSAQLDRTERGARVLAAGIAGALMLIRVTADSSSSMNWLQWATPLGWLEQARPLANPRIGPVIAAIGFAALCAATAVYLAGKRDVDSSVIEWRKTRSSNERMLGGLLPATARMLKGPALTWLAGGLVMGFTTGLISPSASIALADSKPATEGLNRIGVQTTTSAGYLSMMLLLISAAYTVAAAMQVISTKDEEWSGRAENILARPVTKIAWLSDRLLVSVFVLSLMGCTTGVAAWLGAEIRASKMSFPDMAMAGLNLVPPAIFVIGVATFTFGIAPRLVAVVSWTVLVWCFLVRLLSVLATVPNWILDLTVFNYVRLAPQTKPDWHNNAVIVMIGFLLIAFGVLCFTARDLTKTQ